MYAEYLRCYSLNNIWRHVNTFNLWSKYFYLINQHLPGWNHSGCINHTFGSHLYDSNISDELSSLRVIGENKPSRQKMGSSKDAQLANDGVLGE